MDGEKELIAALDRIRGRLTDEAVQAVAVEACQPTAEAMRAGANRLTGDMAESIDARPIDSGRAGVVVVAVGPDNRHAFKARFAEFGTSRQGATPFMRPAWDGDLAALRARLASGLGGLITGGAA